MGIRHFIVFVAYALILAGCVTTMETAEKKEDTGTPVRERDARQTKTDAVSAKREAGVTKRTTEAAEEIEKDPIPSDGIKEETLMAQSTYTPKHGDTVYVTYYTNFVRYVPLRSIPDKTGKILKTLCFGSEMNVLSIQDPWLYVRGMNETVMGWVHKQWVTDDRTVKINADTVRRERAPEIKRLEAIVKPIPRAKWKENLKLYQKLLDLDPCNPYYQRKVDFYENYGRNMKKRKR